MKRVFKKPTFWLGVILRIGLILALSPVASHSWYIPFLDMSVSHFGVDPWATWVSHGGAAAAFPYGYAMWISFLPLVVLTKFLGAPVWIAYTGTLFCVDLLLLWTLNQIVPNQKLQFMGAYWLSPIVILATYGLGLNDLIPALFLTLAILTLKQLKFKLSGAALATAISAKLSMAIAAPFFMIFFVRNKAFRSKSPSFAEGFLGVTLLLGLPFLASKSALNMLTRNAELQKVFSLSVHLNESVLIHLIPLLYTLMLYSIWRLKRFNFILFQATTGVALLAIVLLVPASPGWYIWSLPFLAYYQSQSDPLGQTLGLGFSALYVLSTLTISPLGLNSTSSSSVITTLPSPIVSLLHTAMIAAGFIMIVRIWREGVSNSQFFKQSRKPFKIGIAGDSGAGKDTFANALAGLFGKHSVVHVSGDDYHLWDRQKPMWQVMTHLNPMANDLERFSHDLIQLGEGKNIQTRHYDHQLGKMSLPTTKKSNDYIIATGLHSLYPSILRKFYQLSIYLDLDEDLRRYFKIQRDVTQRRHSLEKVLSSFEKREPDAAKYVRPQANYADLVLSVKPLHADLLKLHKGDELPRLKLEVKTRQILSELNLTRVLVGICGLHVDLEINHEQSFSKMMIEGDASPEDLSAAARMICPRIDEFLDLEPKWEPGVLGLMQLITLTHINQSLSRRFL